MSSECPKCKNPGTPYYQNTKDRIYQYFRHIEDNKSSTCYIGRFKGNIPKRKVNVESTLSVEDIQIIEKLIKRCDQSRNRTAANLLKRIILER